MATSKLPFAAFAGLSLALAGCGSNKAADADAAPTDSTAAMDAADTGGTMGEPSGMASGMDPMATGSAAPMTSETGAATMRGAGTGAPTPMASGSSSM